VERGKRARGGKWQVEGRGFLFRLTMRRVDQKKALFRLDFGVFPTFWLLFGIGEE